MLDKLLPDRFDLNKTAVISPLKSFTFRDLSEKITVIQQRLPQKEGELIAIYLPNGFDYIAAFWSISLLGMVIVPLNVQMTEHEIYPLLEELGAHTVITSRQYCTVFENLIKPELTVIFVEQLYDSNDSQPSAKPRNPDELMLLLSTSGTTGNSKIVQLSQSNIETSVLGYLSKMLYEDEKGDIRLVLATPLSTSYGVMILAAFMICGFTLVLLPDGFTLATLYKAIEVHGVTHYEGGALTIQLMNQMAKRQNPYNISSLKYMCFGGSGLSPREIQYFQANYPQIALCQGYGMSEAAPLISKHQLPDLKKPESSGTAINGVEIAVEADGIITKKPNTKGEIVVRGANVMLGYYNNKKETAKVIKNGYLYSGDIGYVDEEGYLYICGRSKNIIIVRGFNVHPEEIEGCLLDSKLVIDCVVYGETDKLGNEIVCAKAVPIDDEVTIEMLSVYCTAHLAEHKRPRKIMFCDSVKKNAAGKTERIRGA